MKSNVKQKILIVDDHQLFIDGIKALLLDSNAIFYSALTADDALALVEIYHTFDLILLDIKMPGISGLSFLKKLKALENSSPILIISAYASQHIIQDALKQGALGFVSKESSSSVLNKAINTVMQKEVYLAPMWQFLLENGTQKRNSLDEPGITSRQLEILHLVSQGVANKVISFDLGISESTVKAHLHILFKSLNVTNRTHCIQKAKEIGLLQ